MLQLERWLPPSVRPAINCDIAQSNRPVALVDFFGTVVRRIAPSDVVYELTAERLAMGRDENPAAVVEQILAVRRRLDARDQELYGDVGADEVARELADQFAFEHETVDEYVDRYCLLQQSVEALLTRPNGEVIRQLRSSPFERRVLVSDTDLTTRMLLGLLEHHGLGGLFDELVTSSDWRATKRSGVLYDRLLASLSIDPTCAVMIGDNPVADGERAAERGLETIAVRGGRWDGRKRAPLREMRRGLRQTLGRVLAPSDERDIFPEYALTLWLFTHRLSRSLRVAGSSRAVFLAREGIYLERLMRIYQEASAIPPAYRIETSSLDTSRRSVFALDAPGPIEAFDLVRVLEPRPSRAEAAEMLGAQAWVLWGGVDLAQPVTDEDLRLIERDDAARIAVESALAGRRELVTELVMSEVDRSRLDLVDVGWKGTVQDVIASLLGDDVTVHGYYLGIVSSQPVPSPESKTAVLFSNQPEPTKHYQVLGHFKGLHEVLLAAPVGSVVGYGRGAQGTIEVSRSTNQAEVAFHREEIGPFQEAVAGRFAEIASLMAAFKPGEVEMTDLVVAHHARMMYRPRRSEIGFVGRLGQWDNFGAGRFEALGVASPTARGLRRHVSGGGWPPLRMVRAGQGWQRYPYGLMKTLEHRLGRLR